MLDMAYCGVVDSERHQRGIGRRSADGGGSGGLSRIGVIYLLIITS